MNHPPYIHHRCTCARCQLAAITNPQEVTTLRYASTDSTNRSFRALSLEQQQEQTPSITTKDWKESYHRKLN